MAIHKDEQTNKQSDAVATVTRTLRAAIRLGEDFITMEETITLPADASDDDIAQAVTTGQRLYRAQRESLERQVADVRASTQNPASGLAPHELPASERQRNFIATLQHTLGWNDEQLAAYATQYGIDLATLSKQHASQFIESLKQVIEERGIATHTPHTTRVSETTGTTAYTVKTANTPITQRQLQALQRLAAERNIILDDITQQHYSVVASELQQQQAGELITEWQQRSSVSS